MPQSSSLPFSRPPLARMMRIHEELQDGRLTNCSKLARKLEVSAKTIMRDLAFMRNQLDLPVEYDPRTYSWRYGYPVNNFPTVQVSEGELFALLVGQKALEQYKGTPYHDQLAHAFAKLSSGLHDRISFSTSASLGSVSFHQAGLGRADGETFSRLSRAVVQSREIEFGYRKPQSLKTEKRRVRPYHLANRENFWYLVAHDLARGELRNFAVSRMQDVILNQKTFARPADFSAEMHFGRSFGSFVGVDNYHIVVRFSGTAAARVRERLWHESQKIRDLPDGRLEFTVQLNSLEDIRPWILHWGAEAEVVAPQDLRMQIRSSAEAVRKLYSM